MININLFAIFGLMNDWKRLSCLYLYNKNLSEFRKPPLIVNAKDASKLVLIVKKSSQMPLIDFVKKIIVILKSLWILVICFFTPKGRVVFFNHSQRKRLGVQEVRPLYLPCNYFNLSEMIVIESQPNRFSYPKGTISFSFNSLIASASVIGLFLSLTYLLVCRKKDPDIARFVAELYVWRFILNLLKPKSVMLLVWYGRESLIAACKLLNIEVIELQHGIIYEGHDFYNLRGAKEHSNSDFLLPDKCLVYGEYWRENLIKSGWEPRKIDVLGYFLDVVPAKTETKHAPYLLYSTSPYVKEAIIKHILSIEKAAQERGWDIVISLHPVDTREAYEHILSKNVRITGLDAYDALRDCEALIGVSTTLLWEAMIFDKPAFLIEYGFEATDLFHDLIEYGYGKKLDYGEFPELFKLPDNPSKDYFFSSKVKTSLISA